MRGSGRGQQASKGRCPALQPTRGSTRRCAAHAAPALLLPCPVVDGQDTGALRPGHLHGPLHHRPAAGQAGPAPVFHLPGHRWAATSPQRQRLNLGARDQGLGLCRGRSLLLCRALPAWVSARFTLQSPSGHSDVSTSAPLVQLTTTWRPSRSATCQQPSSWGGRPTSASFLRPAPPPSPVRGGKQP